MLSTGVFPPPCNSKSLLTRQCTTTTSLSVPPKTHLSLVPNTFSTGSLYAVFCKNHSFISSLPQFQQTHLAFRVFYQRQGCGLGVRALNKRGTGDVGHMEMDGFDDDEELDDNDDDGDDEGEVVDEDEMLLPFEKMNQWLKNKPRGFGEGKVFDTSIEDKLLEEIEQSMQAQAANVNKLKNDPIPPTSMKNGPKKIAPEVVPSGVQVRVANLPKKKNIQRDLKSAFLGVPGILNIIPAVSGNKKTRDPVCKGFAFVVFKSEEYATRFIQMFSRQSIMFGKIQKQIKCEIMDSQSPNPAHVQSTDIPYTVSHLAVLDLEGDRNRDSNMDDSSLNSWEENNSDESDVLDTELVRADVEDISENLESISVLKVMGDDSMEAKAHSLTHSFSPKKEGTWAPEKELSDVLDTELVRADVEDISENLESISVLKVMGDDSMEAKAHSVTHSFSPKKEGTWAPEKELLAEGKGDKVPEKKLDVKVKGENVLEKKPRAKEKREKVLKLGVPGSAKRLKIKEKAVLADVFSKYGVQAALASQEGS